MTEPDAVSTYQHVLYRVEDRIAHLTLNRPEQRNALSTELRREIVDALQVAERDDEVALILISGAGPSFCSGYQLQPDPEGPRNDWPGSIFNSWTDQFARSCYRDWMTIFDLLKPVVAKVHGYCLAGGTELMSMCDIVFAADDAVIGHPPMRAMATPDVPYFPWKMSMARAKYLQLTGNTVSGKEAAEFGWVVKSFPPDQLDAEVMRELRPMAQISPGMLAANKASLNQAYEAMGIRSALKNGWMMHSLSVAFRPDSRQFAKIAEAEGLRAALDWMNGAFQREGFPM